MHGFDQQWNRLAVIAAVAFGLSYGLGFVVRQWLLRLQVLDRPNERSSHTVPTPRGGGVAIMIAIWGGAATLLPSMTSSVAVIAIFASVALAVVSFLDDRYSVSWRLRFSVQVLAAIAAIVGLWWSGPKPGWAMVTLLSPLFIIWVAGYANAFNFMDGIDGLAASQASLTGVGTALVAGLAGAPANDPAVVLSLLIAGAAAGFLPHNFPRARMFMGDVSSVPLGFLLAFLAIWTAHDRGWWLLVPISCLHANFMLDTAVTLFRRWRRGEVLHQAHREHFYQQLTRAGWKHAVVTATEAGLQALVLLVVIAAVHRGPDLVGLGILVAFITLLWGGFFWFCEMLFRRLNNDKARNFQSTPTAST